MPEPTVPLSEITKKGEEIYARLKLDLEPIQNGKYISIEVESGEHFIGDSRESVVSQAESKYPGKITYSRKIGMVETISRFATQIDNNYGRIFRFN